MRPEVTNLPWLSPAEVHQAEGVLAAQLEITIDEAARVLADRATARGSPVLDAALHVLADHMQAMDTRRLDPWGSC